jgi:hypothetical protein
MRYQNDHLMRPRRAEEEHEKMTTEHRETPEEEAFWRLFEETKGVLSEAAYTLLDTAKGAAYAANMVHNYSFQPQEYEEAVERMRAAAAGLTELDRELLGRLWRTALAAAASIDPGEGGETLGGYDPCRGRLHWYYREASGMIEDILMETNGSDWSRWEEERRGAPQGDRGA